MTMIMLKFLTGRLPQDFFFQCLSASHPLQLLETDSVSEVRVAELTRKLFRIIILFVAGISSLHMIFKTYRR